MLSGLSFREIRRIYFLCVVFNYGDPGLGVSPSLRSFVPSILPSFPQIHGKNLWEKLLEGFKSSNDLTCHMCYWELQYLEAFTWQMQFDLPYSSMPFVAYG